MINSSFIYQFLLNSHKILSLIHTEYVAHGVAVNALSSINKVDLQRAQLLFGQEETNC